ncbi:MAG: hypothetical protein U9Q62_07610 [Campylobacterota bacterium]|nr:hypothetical protein [Campylobacterota bacterium]
MRLENVLALTQGSLTNDPSVTSFDGITFNAKKVKRGNLFIAYEPSSIEEAVLNGAYGIIFDRPTQISDSEIAWIKVTSVEDAMMRLLRFHLLEKELEVYQCDPITLKLAQQIMTPYNFLVLDGNTTDVFKELWYCDDGITVLFSPELTDTDIFTTINAIPELVTSSITIIEQTLFETSFIFDDIFYERQVLSPFFIPFLERLLDFMKKKQIDFRLRSFHAIPHFEPVFTNARFEPQDFGESDKVLIFEPSIALVESQIHFLQQQALWANLIYILPANASFSMHDNANAYYYSSEEEVFDLLRSHFFHFALIAGLDRSFLENSVPNVPQQLTLGI